MAWLTNVQIAIPVADVKKSHVSYCITMYNSSGRNSGTELDPDNATKTVMKSYSEFREFRKLLLVKTSPQRVSAGEQCSCSASCPFLSLHWFIKAFDFPKRSPFLKYRQKSIDKRRKALENFLEIIFARLHGFSSNTLQVCLVRNCSVLRMISQFVDVSDWEVSPLRRSLSLDGWRASFNNALSLRSSMIDEESPIIGNFNLPKLHIRSARIVKHDSIMEDVRYQLIASHEHDFPELMANSVDDQRLWEIALYIACKIGNEYATRMVLSQGVNVDAAVSDGTSCLNIAARMGHDHIVALLLESGADANLANDVGITPLIAASRNGRSQIVRHLLSCNADINLSSNRGTHPIHAAVVSKCLDTVALLIDHGSSVDITTNNGTAPLHFAAKLGLADVTKILLLHGADVNALTRNGSTALSIATANGHGEVVNVLLSYGVEAVSRQSVASCVSIEENRATPKEMSKIVCAIESRSHLHKNNASIDGSISSQHVAPQVS